MADSIFDIISPDGHTVQAWSLPNKQGGGAPYHEDITCSAQLTRFIAQYDHPGRALYYTVAKLREGMTRSQEAVEAVSFIWAEVDFKDHPDIAPEEIHRRLDAMFMKPTLTVFSGHGLHVYWQLNEAEDAAPGKGQETVRNALRLACKYIGGDRSVAETARLMRLPGSHNTRVEGERIPVTVASHTGLTYELGDLVDFWSVAQPILPEPARRGSTAGSPAQPDDFGAPLDTDACLASMQPNGASVNEVQPKVILSLQQKGWHPDEIETLLVDTTMEMADRAGLGWSRDVEEGEVRKRILSGYHKLCNEYDQSSASVPAWLPIEMHDAWAAALEVGRRPQVSRNDGGWHVRSYGASNKGNIGAEGKAPSGDSGATSRTATGQNSSPAAPFVLRPLALFDPAAIPPREFLYGKHYQRRTVGGTVAPGGTGKSSLVMVESVCMALGVDLLCDKLPLPSGPLRVWYHNGEDPMDELHRRLAAICQYYSISLEDLLTSGNLFMTSGNEVPLRVASSVSELHARTDHRLVGCISEQIGDNRIDVAAFDPLVTLHAVSEKDPGKMDGVVRIFGKIADNQDCAVDLSHHTRKLPPGAGPTDYDIDDVRGVKAITDALRAVRILNFMSKEDVESAGLMELERTSHFRIDRGKANYSAPSATAVWRKFANVDLPNGDAVGVVTPWEFPGQGGAPSPEREERERVAERTFLVILDRLAVAGRSVGEMGPKAAPSTFAKEREARAAKLGKAELANAMRRLFDKGRIRIEEYARGGGHTASRIVEV
jgi:RecA-family ATPase